MTSWIRVCAQSELLPGEFKVVWDRDVAIAVFNIDGELYAVDDIFTQDGGERAGGEIHVFEVECPRHGACFDLRSGAAMCPTAYAPSAKLPVKVENCAIYRRHDL